MMFGLPKVLARDPKKRMVLLGGLGVFGVGEMWMPEQYRHALLPGYSEAPLRDAPYVGNPPLPHLGARGSCP